MFYASSTYLTEKSRQMWSGFIVPDWREHVSKIESVVKTKEIKWRNGMQVSTEAIK